MQDLVFVKGNHTSIKKSTYKTRQDSNTPCSTSHTVILLPNDTQNDPLSNVCHCVLGKYHTV